MIRLEPRLVLAHLDRKVYPDETFICEDCSWPKWFHSLHFTRPERERERHRTTVYRTIMAVYWSYFDIVFEHTNHILAESVRAATSISLKSSRSRSSTSLGKTQHQTSILGNGYTHYAQLCTANKCYLFIKVFSGT